MIKTCSVCGITYKANTTNSKYCSLKCYFNNKKINGLSKETKEKISKALKGKTLSEETKIKLNLSRAKPFFKRKNITYKMYSVEELKEVGLL